MKKRDYQKNKKEFRYEKPKSKKKISLKKEKNMKFKE